MREYYQTLARQNTVTPAATGNQYNMHAQANAAEVVRQPLGVSTNAKRNYDDDSGGSGKNKKKLWNESKDRQMPFIKHTGTSGGFPKDDKR